MAALRPRGCYRLPLVAPSEVLESGRGPIASSVQGRAPLFTYWLRSYRGATAAAQGTRQATSRCRGEAPEDGRSVGAHTAAPKPPRPAPANVPDKSVTVVLTSIRAECMGIL